jgi:branched-chain amino acid aminotransferase
MKKIFTSNGIVSELEFPWDEYNTGQSVYEVIRIIDGVALFLEDHFNRLIHSLENLGISFELGFEEFQQKIVDLAAINQISEGNVKFVYPLIQNETKWLFAFIPHNYPSRSDYLNGVSTDFLFDERENPNAKINQNSLREKADQLIHEQKLYEMLLVDRNGMITEGSRSNVFFVKDDVFFTAPSSKVLVGITRQKVIECLNDLGFILVEEAVKASEINQFDGVFLTGTSPKVLPVRSIGNQIFTAKLSVVKKLMESYDERITQYILLAKTSY